MHEPTDPDGPVDALTAFDKKLGGAAFWKLQTAAQMLGLTPRMLHEDIAAGRVPIALRYFGSRELAYVSSADTRAFIKSKGAAA